MNDRKSIFRKVKDTLKSNFITDQLFWEEEIQANCLVGRTLLYCSFVLALCWLLNVFGIFTVDKTVMAKASIHGLLELLIPMAICNYFSGKKKWLKYLLLIEMTIVLARIDSILSFKVHLIMVIPVVLSIRYYSRAFCAQISVLSTIIFAISSFCTSYFNIGQLDLNYYDINPYIYAQNYMIHSFLPQWMIFAVIASVCAEVAKSGKMMVLKQDESSRQHQRVETELEMAAKIQKTALPSIDTIAELNDGSFELFASMEPAKEVGGDFYNYFYIDPNHLALIIADVSGKGVPASLFMMISKILLDITFNNSRSPAKILEEVNHILCKKNLHNMFVTVWLGIIDLETGDMITANAGHEYPVICRKGQYYELYKDKHGIVLGAKDGIKYSDELIHFEPGDKLFVYTDGVMEAKNDLGRLYGVDHMIDILNFCKDSSPTELISNMQNNIHSYENGTEQFDDITMMAFQFINYKESKGIILKPDSANMQEVLDYVNKILDDNQIDNKIINKIKIVVDELYSNIINYSRANWAEIMCDVNEKEIELTFRDNGILYNPLKTKKPNITGTAKERQMGGLGIYMVKNIMDDVSYSQAGKINTTKVKYIKKD